MISHEDYQVIVKLDPANSSPEARTAFIDDNGHMVVKVFNRLLGSIAKDQTLQYILTVIDDIITVCVGYWLVTVNE